ncbi:MAG: hypothetical protein BWY89_01060 [Bacteroidetes bacterium ADurb.BinA012]|nr:MAG: hypothetical protein BWY89_01060 [Bacteroidetes bacterium ADurb.BinA012]
MAGTSSRTGVTLNFAFIAACTASALVVTPWRSMVNPIIRKITIVRISDGTVVWTMYLTCVKRSVPATAGARLVVSDRGDILSPKYAPDMIAPAIIASLNPRAFPIPSSATPMVATVDHELPVLTDTRAQMTTAANRNILGWSISRP